MLFRSLNLSVFPSHDTHFMVAIAEGLSTLKTLSQQLYEQDYERDRERRRLKVFNRIITRANESKTQKDLVQGILDACIE